MNRRITIQTIAEFSMSPRGVLEIRTCLQIATGTRAMASPPRRHQSRSFRV